MKKRIISSLMVVVIGLFLISMEMDLKVFASPDAANRISIVNNQFYVGEKPIWISGANTPWNSWNDFGGNFDYTWWDNHFKELNKNGINATRVWITCNGDVGINIDDTGNVSGATEKHWSDLDQLFEIAKNNKVYIMATLISFDHFKDANANYQKWRNMITNGKNIDSYVKNYVIPFANRYKENPWLWSIDLCNEPDWIFENKDCGNIPWDNIIEYFAKTTVAIHENSNILVTVGLSMIKYNSDLYQGNMVSDARLQEKVNSKLAKLDFYSPHHYSWQDQWFKIPFYMTPVDYKLDGTKPAVIGECPANGSTNSTLTDDYLNGYKNGWQGVMPWTSNGVDANGDITSISPAAKKMLTDYENLIYPQGRSEPVGTSVEKPDQTVASEEASSTKTAGSLTIDTAAKNDTSDKKYENKAYIAKDNQTKSLLIIAAAFILCIGGFITLAVYNKRKKENKSILKR